MMTQGWRRFDWNKVRGQALAAMEFEPEDLRLRGTVTDLHGKPMSGVKVQVENTDVVAMSDEAGAFEFSEEMLPGNKIYVLLEKDKHKQRVSVNTSQKNIDINLYRVPQKKFTEKLVPAEKSYAAGVVVQSDLGDALIGATILFEKDGRHVAGTVTDIDGKFSVQLDPGNYTFKASYTGFDSRQGEVSVKENYVNEMEIFLMTSGVSLDEVVVTGMGIERMKKNMSSVSKVQRKESKKSRKRSRVKNKDVVIDGVKIQAAPPAANEMEWVEEIEAPAPVELDDMAIVKADRQQKKRELAKPQASRSRRAIGRNKLANNYYQPTEFYTPVYNKKEQAVPVTQRTDFRPTIYWNPLIETGMDGTASVEFYTSDALTSFRATVEGFGQEGSLGRGKKVFSNEIPMGINVKLPARVLMGDELDIPVILSNKTDQTVNGKLSVELPEELELIEKYAEQVTLTPQQSNTIFVKVKVLSSHPGATLKIGFEGGGFKDNMKEKMEILSRGFPVERGYTSQETSHTFTLNVKEPVNGSVRLSLNAQSSLDEQMMADLKRMARQPSGCFEQTSSSNYPNLLVLDYLRATGNLDSKTEKKLKGFLASGYKRLTGYEVKGGGFDWFGKPPGHEALTAYGILQFVDMAKVFEVDKKMIERNAKWLLNRRNGEGGWKLSKRGLHSWKSNDPVYDAYIVWALVEAGMGGKIKKEIEKSTTDALASEDPYLLALMANALGTLADKRTNKLLDILLTKQAEDGKWGETANTVVNSRGISKDVETTGLAALAMIKSRPDAPQLIPAMDFLRNAKTNYGYGSTQATVLALKAMTAYAVKIDDGRRSGTLAVFVNGKKVGNQAYGQENESNIVLEDLGQYLKTGKNKVKVKFDNKKSVIPFYLGLSYHTLLPDNHPACALKLTTKLARKKAKMGGQLRLSAVVENVENAAVTNPIIKLGIPAGLTVQAWQLKEMEEKQIFDYYELFDGYLVLYFRELGPAVSKTINLDLKADIPGSYEAAASSAWLYYANEAVTWSKPGRVEVE